MELHSDAEKKKDPSFKELQLTLKGLGIYEEGMDLHEMRQTWVSFQQSVGQTVTNFLKERAEMEEQQESREIPEIIIISIMLNEDKTIKFYYNTSTVSSPEIPSTKIVVHADVHHEMDWDPIKENSSPEPDAPGKATLNEESLRNHNAVTKTKEKSCISNSSNSVLDSEDSFFELSSSVLMCPTGTSSFESSNSNAIPEATTSRYDRIQATYGSRRIISEKCLNGYKTSETSL